MKKAPYIFMLLISIAWLTGCQDDEVVDITERIAAPSNITAIITVAEDNSGMVRIIPNGEGVAQFQIFYGDESEMISIAPGESVSHTYENGDYMVRIVGVGINGLETVFEQEITVVIETVTEPEVIALPLGFELEASNYVFVDFGGASGSVVENPDVDADSNNSSQTGQYVKAAGSEVWAGTFIELPLPIDFSSTTSLYMDTWSPKSGITVKMKLENATDPDVAVEVDVTNTVASGWETLQFDFGGLDLTKEYSKVVVFFDFGVSGNDDVYYFDNIKQLLSDIEDFETEVPEFTTFGNIEDTEVVDNPNPNGLNTTTKVANLTKNSGSEVWAGTFIEKVNPLDLNTFSKIKVLTHAPKSGITIKLKLENATNPDINYEVDLVNTIANQWEELVFDMSDAPDEEYAKVVIFFDFGNAGDGSEYYFDEIELQN